MASSPAVEANSSMFLESLSNRSTTDPMGLEKLKDDILKELESNDVESTLLVGESGDGKTWMVRKIREYVMSRKLAYGTVWLSLRNYDSKSPLLPTIAAQLSLFPTIDEWEDDSIIKKEEETVSEKEEDTVKREKIKKKILENAEKMRAAMQEKNKFLLLILDDVTSSKVADVVSHVKAQLLLKEKGDDAISNVKSQLPLKEKVDDVISVVKAEPPLREKKLLKVLITASKDLESYSHAECKKFFLPKPFSNEESLSTQGEVAEKVSKFVDSIDNAEDNVGQSDFFPAPIYVFAKARKYIGEDKKYLSEKEKALEEASSYADASNAAKALIRFGYEMLPTKNEVVIKCFSHAKRLLSQHGGVHYNELIASWILEGCFGPVESVENAYEKGHRVLMDLINWGFLKIQDANLVILEQSALTISDYRLDRFSWTPILDWTTASEDGKWEGFGRIASGDGVIRTICSGKNQKPSTLLIDGGRLCREVDDAFFESMKDLQVLALFSPRFDRLPSSLTLMKKLHLLVLRGCDRIEKINSLQELNKLTVLEVSGAKNLKKIPEDLFKNLSELQIINFSETGIESIPDSLSNLTKLHSLILRDCSCLLLLPQIKSSLPLQVLDLSGATSFVEIKDKCLLKLKELEMIDLSQTKIKSFPILKEHSKLTRILLRDCKELIRLRNFKLLSGLEVLDLSGSINMIEIHDECFQDKLCLKILDLSNTAISRLPSGFDKLTNLELLFLSGIPNLVELEDNTFESMTFLRHLDLSNSEIENLPALSNLTNLRELDLRKCKKLQKLPTLNSLIKLEVLCLSGCSSLDTLEDDSFEHLTCLRRLNLSETKIQHLPSLPSKPDNLSKLEELNLSGAKCLEDTEAQFLDHMNDLQILNLSGTKFRLGSLSNLSNLTKLSLKGLSFEAELDLVNLTKLEVLDLSETKMKSLPPSLNNLSNLRQLLLRDSLFEGELPNLDSLNHLEVLDLWGTRIKKFPYWITGLTRLKRLDLPVLTGISDLDWEKIQRLPGELNWNQCGIFDPDRIQSIKNRPSITISDMDSFQTLRGKPELWNTCFKKFYISVRPSKEKVEDGDMCCLIGDATFKNIFFSTMSYHDQHVPFLEIRGYDTSPAGIEDALTRADYISLIENMFVTKLSDLGKVDKLKGCWVVGCTNVRTIFHEEDEAMLGEDLEILWVSNIPKMESLYCGSWRFENFENLKHLCIDCCPLIEILFPAIVLPQKLEIIQIKFCDKLKTLFECESPEESKLPYLHTLDLIELPELTSIGPGLPALRRAKIRNCPKLEDFKEILPKNNSYAGMSEIEEAWDGTTIFKQDASVQV